MGTEKWALGIFDRGEKKIGNRTYRYSKNNSRRETPMIVSEAMVSREIDVKEWWKDIAVGKMIVFMQNENGQSGVAGGGFRWLCRVL